MAAAPKWKVFNAAGVYMAACKEPSDAAMLVAGYGEGASVRLGHTKRATVWTEGKEAFSAGESYDRAAVVMIDRAAP